MSSPVLLSRNTSVLSLLLVLPAVPAQVLPEGTALKGGSPFVPLPGGSRFLAVVHHTCAYTHHSAYSHHWVMVSVSGGQSGKPQFAVDWVSETFMWVHTCCCLNSSDYARPCPCCSS